MRASTKTGPAPARIRPTTSVIAVATASTSLPSTATYSRPYPAARADSGTGCWSALGENSAYPLFSQKKTIGSFHSAARLAASWKAPWATAPSPKNDTTTVLFLRSRAAVATPAAIGTPAATIPLAPKIPRSGSAMCMEPPRPLFVPVTRASSSAIIGSGGSPLARQCPWPRWLEVIPSVSVSGQQAPTADASWPIDRCTKPGTSPSR